MRSTVTKDFGILSSIGNTPLLHLSRLFPDHSQTILGKLELLNPGGSLKDRTSTAIIGQAMDLDLINDGTTIIESTSGNMGIGLAQACLYYGIKLILVVDPLLNASTGEIIKAYGAQLVCVNEKDDSGSYLKTRLAKVQELLGKIDNSYWTNQYANKWNPLAHRQTMSEILAQCNEQLDYLFVATSTCGTMMGCAEEVKARGLSTEVIPVDAAGSLIFSEVAGKRIIPGMGASRPSDFLDTALLGSPVHMKDVESVLGCRKLLRREAILAGGSTGAVVSAIEKKLPELDKNATIAFFINDRGERYLNTIYSDKWLIENFDAQELFQIFQD